MRRRRILAAVTVLSALLFLAAWPAGCTHGSAGPTASPPAAASPAPATLRVLTYNIRHGLGIDKKLDLARIAAVIKSARPDVVALEEVDQKTARSNGVDQAEELGRLTGLHASFGKAMNYGGGGYGVAVLSRWPIDQAITHKLPGKPGREPRAALQVRLRMGQAGPGIEFVATHLEHELADDRQQQVQKIQELAAPVKADLIVLAGDFNDTPDSKPILALTNPQKAADRWIDSAAGEKPQAMLTFPADNPDQKIDYIFYRAARGVRVREIKVLDEPAASDHRPLLAVLEMQ